jgi:hypothetical protein
VIVQPVAAGEAEGGMREVAVACALRGDVDVGDEQILGMHGRRPVGDPDNGDRQPRADAGARSRPRPSSSPRDGRLEDLTEAWPSIWSPNESPVPVTARASFPQSSKIFLGAWEVFVGRAGEHGRAACGMEAEHEQAVVVSRTGEVLVLVHVGDGR